MDGERTTFHRMLQENPCDGCPAPCCRVHLSPCKVPETFMDLDFVRYSLLFPGTECLVGSDGRWSLLRWQTCQAFAESSCTCTLHGTPQKPRICVTFNPHACWYKRNFTTDSPPDLYRLNLARFEAWVEEIEIDAAGRIAAVPTFERSQELLGSIPLERFLALDSRLVKPKVPTEPPAPPSEP